MITSANSSSSSSSSTIIINPRKTKKEERVKAKKIEQRQKIELQLEHFDLEAKVKLEARMTQYQTEKRDYDAYQNKKYAQLLLKHISRKVVKQTVMTSVYGVTFIGARKQIQSKLEDALIDRQTLHPDWETEVYEASCYAAQVTMQSMGNLFNSAREIMDWLGSCARTVADQGQAMSWITPLGLPVVQPYRHSGTYQVKTKMQMVRVGIFEYLIFGSCVNS